MQIVPAILSNESRVVRDWLKILRDLKKFEKIQIDFIDGEYVDNKTIKPCDLDIMPYLPLVFDAHLMVTQNNVDAYARCCRKVGYDRVIPQVESISTPENYEGLALDIHSPVEAIEPYLRNLEVVVVMAVEPGHGGQSFDARVLQKTNRLRDLRKYRNGRFRICVDGGVHQEYLQELAEAGADEVAVGADRVLTWGIQ